MIPALQCLVLRHLLIVAAFLFSFQTTQAGADERPPVLKLAKGRVSEDGHVKIEWEPRRADAAVEVQQAGNKSFEKAKTIYHGFDNATFVSGLEDGRYYYRIRHAGGPWSDTIMLTVKHHSLRLAFVLFSLGAVVFVLTVFVVVKGALHASDD